jgi:two-component system response regulator HydG
MLERGLTAAGYDSMSCTAAAEALERIGARDFDVVVTDVRMPRMGGLELCQRIAEMRPDLPVVVITAFGNIETAIEAIRAGAYDFIVKPFELEAVRIAVRRAVERHRLVQRVERLEHALRGARDVDGIIGGSAPMRPVFDLLDRVAGSDATVLVTGESGTGKELVARALHRRSPRASRPFVAVNCAAMPETLLESELFGHVRGAFTDAKNDRAGLFQQGEGGTIFLDEIGDLPLGLQPKLLRALQERTIRPVGGQTEVPFDARVVAATNIDLERAVAGGKFREDLFYRVNVIEIALPPLRARGNDVLLLARWFIERYASLGNKPITGILPAAAEKLLAYSWPGNVRELQNCMERAVTLCRYTELTVDDLPDKIRNWQPKHIVLDSDDLSEFVPMDTIERNYVERVFEAAGRNKSLAASILGFNRKTLYRKLRRYGILPSVGREEE